MRNKKIISLVPRSEILRKSEFKIWVKIRIIQIRRIHVNLLSAFIRSWQPERPQSRKPFLSLFLPCKSVHNTIIIPLYYHYNTIIIPLTIVLSWYLYGILIVFIWYLHRRQNEDTWDVGGKQEGKKNPYSEGSREIIFIFIF